MRQLHVLYGRMMFMTSVCVCVCVYILFGGINDYNDKGVCVVMMKLVCFHVHIRLLCVCELCGIVDDNDEECVYMCLCEMMMIMQ